METPLSNPKAIAELGEKIYREQYFKEQFEREHSGKFVAIDVSTQKAYIADTPEDVLEAARADAPIGIFHLIRLGADSDLDGIFR